MPLLGLDDRHPRLVTKPNKKQNLHAPSVSSRHSVKSNKTHGHGFACPSFLRKTPNFCRPYFEGLTLKSVYFPGAQENTRDCGNR